jgi:NADH-quinone oxidoreductase subunit J
MSSVVFFIAAIGAVGGAVGVVSLHNAFYSVLALVTHLISLAALFLLLRAEFIAAAQVIVYAGAVMVLYVFVVGYVGGMEPGLAGRSGPGLRALSIVFALALFIELSIALIGSAVDALDTRGAPYQRPFGEPAEVGRQFLTTYLVAFEAASLLLLVAAIGAVMLARRRRGLEGPDEAFELRVRAPRPAYTGTMAEAAGVRQAIEATEEEIEPEVEAEVVARGSEERGGW